MSVNDSFHCVFGLKQECFIMDAGWLSCCAVVRGLVILNVPSQVKAGSSVVFSVSLWSCSVSQLDLCLFVLNAYLY